MGHLTAKVALVKGRATTAPALCRQPCARFQASQSSSRPRQPADGGSARIAPFLVALVIGLIALFSSYDHVTVAGQSLPLPQQWGIPCIAASVALVLVEFV